MDDEQVRNAFGRWLRRLRERDGRTAKRLSLDAGLEPSYVAKLESGAIKAPGDPDKWRPLARELRVPDPVMAAAVGGFFPDDVPQALLPPLPRVLTDPNLPREIVEAVRPLLPDVPEDEVYALARAMAAVQRLRREEIEAQFGPAKALPPADSNRPGRDGMAG